MPVSKADAEYLNSGFVDILGLTVAALDWPRQDNSAPDFANSHSPR